MQVFFVNQSGKTFAPAFYTVYYKNNGRTFKRIEDELNMHNFCQYADITKIELYENGLKNAGPVLKDTIFKEDFMCDIIPQYSNRISKAV